MNENENQNKIKEKRKKNKNQNKLKKYPRQKKEVPRPSDAPNGWEKWCYEKKMSYSMYSKNPNSYYFRFNEKGDKEKFGPFSNEEEQLFKQRLREYGSGAWGLFSMAVPGRCGYICANYFRKKLNEDQDFFQEFGKDYKIINGKLVFKGEKKCRPNKVTREKQRNEAIHFRKLWHTHPEKDFNNWLNKIYSKYKKNEILSDSQIGNEKEKGNEKKN
ncbi:transcription factor myb77 [Anaeramoeba flamelloides]|uniref:Transcription factor myb77 n=1 Tax=Anaeramoeba flamelloides TaxID=1746091 RepID=A0ABQ8X4M5_9EUKA|nr:transcription factor myb77 [Anaeramoeba flamelloides]